jgi:hypothetical protein
MTPNAASLPVEETTIAALHAAYLSGQATAVSVWRPKQSHALGLHRRHAR